jgi:hypothetical protein
MIHRTDVEGYPGGLRELTEDIGNLRYDALSELLRLLASKLETDATADLGRARPKLAAALRASAASVSAAAASIDAAWRICEPHV